MVDKTTRSRPAPDDNVRAFKLALAGLRRRKRFVPNRESGRFAEELLALLSRVDDVADPRTGVELMAAFYRADGAVLGPCDDSSGIVGDVYRIDAHERFVHHAVRCEDKEWLAGLLFDLLEEDEYSMRSRLLDSAARYLPATTLRMLAEREWMAAKAIAPQADFVRDWPRRHRLVLVEMIARQLNDPRLFERARRETRAKLVTADHTHIAEAWLAAGEAGIALEWLERVNAGDSFMADEREKILVAVYRQLGRRDELEQLLWKRFRASWSRERLDALLEVIGADRRAAVVGEAARSILHAIPFEANSAVFLLEWGRADEAAEYVVTRRAQVDGDYWPPLVPLARGLEDALQPLAATVIYRALLDSILKRAQSKTYGHGARYLRKLAKVSLAVGDWKDVAPHGEYVAFLRERHARKSSFWKLIPDGD